MCDAIVVPLISKPLRVMGIGQVAKHDLHRGHAGEPQQVPASGVCSQVLEARGKAEFLLQHLGQHLAAQGVDASNRIPVVEGGESIRPATAHLVAVDGDEQISPGSIGEVGSIRFIVNGLPP